MDRAPPTSRASRALSRLPRLSLRAQLLLAFGLIASVPAALVGLSAARRLEAVLSDQARREMHVVSEALGRDVTALVSRDAEVVRSLAEDIATMDLAETDALSAYLASRHRDFPGFLQLVLIDPRGICIGAALPTRSDGAPVVGTVYADRAYFKKARAGAEHGVSELLSSRSTGGRSFAVYATVRDAKGAWRALIAGTVDLASVQNTLDQVARMLPGVDAYLLDERGQVIVAARPAAKRPVDDLSSFPLYRRPPGGEIEHRVGPNERGVEMAGAVSALVTPSVEWTIAALRSRDQLAGVVRAGVRPLFVGGAVALCLGLAIAVVLASTLARPITRLVEVVEPLGRGDLRHSIDVVRGWHPIEVTQLVQSVATTVAGLRGLVAQIHGTAEAVTSLTAELRSASQSMVQDSEQQRSAVTDASEVIVQLADSIKGVNTGVRTLGASTDEAARAIAALDEGSATIGTRMQELSGSIAQSGRAADELLRRVDDIVLRTDNLNQHVEGTKSALGQLVSSVQRVQGDASESQRITHRMSEDATAGVEAVRHTTAAMEEIRESFMRLNDIVAQLSSSSASINRIIDVIGNVARATSLLAFNASIIASQAGEHGKGFMVVAERVKSVAEDTTASTREIASIIGSVQAQIREAVEEVAQGQQKVMNGVHLSSQAGERLGVIIGGASRSTDTVLAIVAATRQQSQHLVHVARAVEDLQGIVVALDAATEAQARASRDITDAVQSAHDIGETVKRTTMAQAAESQRISSAVQAINQRVQAVQRATDDQNADRGRLAASVDVFNVSADTGVRRARQIEAAVASLNGRLERLERALREFQV